MGNPLVRRMKWRCAKPIARSWAFIQRLLKAVSVRFGRGRICMGCMGTGERRFRLSYRFFTTVPLCAGVSILSYFAPVGCMSESLQRLCGCSVLS